MFYCILKFHSDTTIMVDWALKISDLSGLLKCSTENLLHNIKKYGNIILILPPPPPPQPHSTTPPLHLPLAPSDVRTCYRNSESDLCLFHWIVFSPDITVRVE